MIRTWEYKNMNFVTKRSKVFFLVNNLKLFANKKVNSVGSHKIELLRTITMNFVVKFFVFLIYEKESEPLLLDVVNFPTIRSELWDKIKWTLRQKKMNSETKVVIQSEMFSQFTKQTSVYAEWTSLHTNKSTVIINLFSCISHKL